MISSYMEAFLCNTETDTGGFFASLLYLFHSLAEGKKSVSMTNTISGRLHTRADI